SWKTWERGVPDVAVEIVSDSDASETPWNGTLQRYQELGVKELVRFDPEETAGRQLRLWDRVEGKLVERTDPKDGHFCKGLSLYWVVVPTLRHPAALRLARDAEGRDLVLTPEETEGRAREAADRAREAEARAREAAEKRVAELEAQLRLQKG
ncbi:MAG TPA: Uma2 family endonuclease, partial [Polyangiaceae bacterium]|nr:Uma2 family endonuclease [Polyangiaceae bacterium]